MILDEENKNSIIGKDGCAFSLPESPYEIDTDSDEDKDYLNPSMADKPNEEKNPRANVEGEIHLTNPVAPSKLSAYLAFNPENIPHEIFYEGIINLLKRVFKVPIASVSLRDKCYGISDDTQLIQGTFRLNEWNPATTSYIPVPDCVDILVIEDARNSLFFGKNTFVLGPPYVAFFAGSPLIGSSGYRFGTVSMCDFEPHSLPNQSYLIWNALIKIIADDIDSYSTENTTRSEPFILLDTGVPNWPVIFANNAWQRKTGMKLETMLSNFWDVFQLVDSSVNANSLIDDLSTENSFILSVKGFGIMLDIEFSKGILFDSPEPLIFGSLANLQSNNSKPSNTSVEQVLDGINYPDFRNSGLLRLQNKKNQNKMPNRICTVVEEAFSPKIRSSCLQRNSGSFKDTEIRSECITSNKDGFLNDAFWRLESLHLGPLLGRGANAIVYRGIWKRKKVAIKVTYISMPTKQDRVPIVKKALHEASTSMRLMHACIVPTLDYRIKVWHHNGALSIWLVQHLCDKGTLYDCLQRGEFRSSNELFLNRVLNTAADIASALDYLHCNCIVHGDLSGNNILFNTCSIDRRGFKSFLSDFGCSKFLHTKETLQKVGTITHSPPERIFDDILTKSSDVYGLGVLIWEMWNGRRAYAGIPFANILYQIKLGRRLEMPKDCPVELRQLVHDCMMTNRESRPSIEDVCQRLREMITKLLN